jgi:hypothetical protein
MLRPVVEESTLDLLCAHDKVMLANKHKNISGNINLFIIVSLLKVFQSRCAPAGHALLTMPAKSIAVFVSDQCVLIAERISVM